MANPLAADLDQVLAQTSGLWDELRGARLFITGGTGFFGCWLLETLLWANHRHGLDVSVVVLTRNAKAFERKAPHLARHAAVSLREGEIRTFPFIDDVFTHVVHAATDSSVTLAHEDRLLMFDAIVEGTRRTLEFARRSRATRYLLTSSGAVYGCQPAELTHIGEDYRGGPDLSDWRQVYAEGKRAAEMLCALYADAQLQPTIARCFAFVGPYLPLDVHFAVGNFIRDAMNGGPIRIAGDGTPYRSYLYAADLAVWLWTILLKGEPLRPYNVGSEQEMSIADLARTVARTLSPSAAVDVRGTPVPGRPAERYVPSTARIRQELGVAVTVDLDDALRRTMSWHHQRLTVTHVRN